MKEGCFAFPSEEGEGTQRRILLQQQKFSQLPSRWFSNKANYGDGPHPSDRAELTCLYLSLYGDRAELRLHVSDLGQEPGGGGH